MRRLAPPRKGGLFASPPPDVRDGLGILLLGCGGRAFEDQRNALCDGHQEDEDENLERGEPGCNSRDGDGEGAGDEHRRRRHAGGGRTLQLVELNWGVGGFGRVS